MPKKRQLLKPITVILPLICLQLLTESSTNAYPSDISNTEVTALPSDTEIWNDLKLDKNINILEALQTKYTTSSKEFHEIALKLCLAYTKKAISLESKNKDISNSLLLFKKANEMITKETIYHLETDENTNYDPKIEAMRRYTKAKIIILEQKNKANRLKTLNIEKTITEALQAIDNILKEIDDIDKAPTFLQAAYLKAIAQNEKSYNDLWKKLYNSEYLKTFTSLELSKALYQEAIDNLESGNIKTSYMTALRLKISLISILNDPLKQILKERLQKGLPQKADNLLKEAIINLIKEKIYKSHPKPSQYILLKVLIKNLSSYKSPYKDKAYDLIFYENINTSEDELFLKLLSNPDCDLINILKTKLEVINDNTKKSKTKSALFLVEKAEVKIGSSNFQNYMEKAWLTWSPESYIKHKITSCLQLLNHRSLLQAGKDLTALIKELKISNIIFSEKEIITISLEEIIKSIQMAQKTTGINNVIYSSDAKITLERLLRSINQNSHDNPVKNALRQQKYTLNINLQLQKADIPPPSPLYAILKKHQNYVLDDIAYYSGNQKNILAGSQEALKALNNISSLSLSNAEKNQKEAIKLWDSSSHDKPKSKNSNPSKFSSSELNKSWELLQNMNDIKKTSRPKSSQTSKIIRPW